MLFKKPMQTRLIWLVCHADKFLFLLTLCLHTPLCPYIIPQHLLAIPFIQPYPPPTSIASQLSFPLGRSPSSVSTALCLSLSFPRPPSHTHLSYYRSSQNSCEFMRLQSNLVEPGQEIQFTKRKINGWADVKRGAERQTNRQCNYRSHVCLGNEAKRLLYF